MISNEIRRAKSAETLGEELARTVNYDGIEILRAAYHALTAANFHEEAALLSRIIFDAEI
jgi:hypothetical protein